MYGDNQKTIEQEDDFENQEITLKSSMSLWSDVNRFSSLFAL